MSAVSSKALFARLPGWLSGWKKRFNKLFWKIFLALWITSFSVMLATVSVIGEMAERNSLLGKLEFKARFQAERFIESYERGDSWSNRRWFHEWRTEWRGSPHYRYSKPVPVDIYDAEENHLLGTGKDRRGDVLELKLRSSSGQEYRVCIPVSPVQSHMSRLKAFLFSLQAISVLISSTLASFLLSWVVVRPMNRLRQNVVKLHSGELSIRADDKLRSRGDEIGDFAREFNKMADYVERTLQGRQRLFQDVSHELRAPLARLQAAAGLAEQRLGEDNPAVRRINLECERLSLLIDELLSLARLDQDDEAKQHYDLRGLVQQQLDDLRFSQPERPIELLAAESIDWMCCGNLLLLERALSNVLGNVQKHTEQQVSVKVALSAVSSGYRIEIRDFGPGVEAQALQKLCEPFFRSTKDSNGYGLGLSIARHAMQRMDGSLEVENAEPSGLRVILTLPKGS